MVYKLESKTYNTLVYMVESNKDLKEIYDSLNFKDGERSYATQGKTMSFFYYRLLDDRKTRTYFIFGTVPEEGTTMEAIIESFVKYRIKYTMNIDNLETMKNELCESYQKEHTLHRPEQAYVDQYKYICKINNIEYTDEGYQNYKTLMEEQKGNK